MKAPQGSIPPAAGVTALRPFGDDAELLAAVRDGRTGAALELYDRYAAHVRRVLSRVMGIDRELPDLLNEVFTRALEGIRKVEDGSRLKAWLTRVAVFTARTTIRNRSRGRWLTFHPEPETLGGEACGSLDPEAVDFVRAVREVVGGMAADDRVVFGLRFVEGMDVDELADACGVSRATAKRRLARCETRFKRRLAGYPDLVERLERSGKWRRR
jgi:RNA polymerase sigma-70 factor (ECF subfamily)